jgi:hypothetical protein
MLRFFVSSAAEGFKRSGSSRQCFAASMSVFVKLKLVGDFYFFLLFCDFVWVFDALLILPQCSAV